MPRFGALSFFSVVALVSACGSSDASNSPGDDSGSPADSSPDVHADSPIDTGSSDARDSASHDGADDTSFGGDTADTADAAESADSADAGETSADTSIADAPADADAETPPDGDACTVGCDGELLGTTDRGRTIVVDDANIYVAKWVGSGIQWAPKTGGAFVDIPTPSSEDIHALFVDGSDLLFTTSDGSRVHVRRVPKTGGTVTELFSAYPASNLDIHNVVADATTIYFASSTGAGGTPSIRKIDKATGAVSVLYPGVGGFLAQDATNLYWVGDRNLSSAPKLAGSIVKMETVFSGTRDEIVVDAGSLFYNAEEDYVEMHSVTTSAPFVDTTLQPAFAVASVSAVGPGFVDAKYVYELNSGDFTVGGAPGAIYRVPRAGGSLGVFAADPKPTGIAGDATYLYWTNYASQVRRKPL